MNINNFTIKSQEAIQKAQLLTQMGGQQHTTLHKEKDHNGYSSDERAKRPWHAQPIVNQQASPSKQWAKKY